MSTSTRLPGACIGKYRILAHVATGGMGTVYKALDEELGRVVALKVLAAECASSEVLVERFRREARHAAALSHKNIVTLYDWGQADGAYYLAMEYIDGIDLGEYIRRKGQLDPEESRRILIQACKALEHAFAQGIIHRDIKPSNFLLANEEGRCRVKLTDLGLARMESDEEYRVTRDGSTVGTVDYLSPEQARDSRAADIRSDIYSLGCTFYHMLAGQPPFSEGGIGERVYKHIASDPPDIREMNPRVPAGLWTVLRRMLAKHPDDRFQTPSELIQALRSLADLPAIQAAGEDDFSPGSSDIVAFEPPTHGLMGRFDPAPTSPIEMAASRAARHGERAEPRQRRTAGHRRRAIPDDPSDALGISVEQRQAAAGQFARATEVIAEGSESEYALQLLFSCCKLDPVNTTYRKKLREVAGATAGKKKGSWFSLGTLTNLPARSRLKAAKRAGDHRKVLEHGEELLSRSPGEVSVQLDMAESAEALNLLGLANWMLEEARSEAPEDLTILVALASLYERHNRLTQAIQIWEKIREVDPYNPTASTKIKDLAAADTIARNKSRR